MVSAKIIERFEITGRGTTIGIDAESELPMGHRLRATIYQSDGSANCYDASKEWLLRRNPHPVEREVFLIADVAKSEIPPGASIILELADSQSVLL